MSDAEGMAELQSEYDAFRNALTEVLETQIEFFPLITLWKQQFHYS